MRFKLSILALLLASLLTGGAAAHAQKAKEKGKGAAVGGEMERGAEASVAATESVNVTLATGGGRIVVRGWDRNEVRARTEDPQSKITFHKAGGTEPAARLEVVIYEATADEEEPFVNSDVTLDVPRGATLYLRTLDGDIDVEDVAEARVTTAGGRIDLRRIRRATEATSVGGDVTLEDSAGRARLTSFGSVIEVRGLRQAEASDFLEVKTASGDIVLDGIGPARVKASTVEGVLKLVGPLARGGSYDFTTTTGDVTLVLPPDSSFNLNARISEGGEIVTEFPIKSRGTATPMSHMRAGRLAGVYGSGDSTINLVSFSGTIRLRKK